jgi:hypothetical protein
MLVERAIAELVEIGARPQALQQPQRREAVGDQGDAKGLDADDTLLEAGLAAGRLDFVGDGPQRDAVAADEAAGDERAQKGARIVGRDGDLSGQGVTDAGAVFLHRTTSLEST